MREQFYLIIDSKITIMSDNYCNFTVINVNIIIVQKAFDFVYELLENLYIQVNGERDLNRLYFHLIV